MPCKIVDAHEFESKKRGDCGQTKQTMLQGSTLNGTAESTIYIFEKRNKQKALRHTISKWICLIFLREQYNNDVGFATANHMLRYYIPESREREGERSRQTLHSALHSAHPRHHSWATIRKCATRKWRFLCVVILHGDTDGGVGFNSNQRHNKMDKKTRDRIFLSQYRVHGQCQLLVCVHDL